MPTKRVALGPRDRRALFWGATLLAPVVLWRLVIGPGSAHLSELRGFTERERELLGRELALLNESERMADQADVLVSELVDFAPRLIKQSESPEEMIQHVASRSNVTLNQIERLPADGMGDDGSGVVRESRFWIVAESDLEGMLTLIAGIAESDRLFSVPSLHLRAAAPADEGAPEVIAAEITIGVFLSPATTAAFGETR